MNTLQLLTAEMWHRKLNVLLTLVALVAAAALLVAGPLVLSGYHVASNRQLQTMQQETAAALDDMRATTETELKKMEEEAEENLAHLEKRTRRIMRDLGFNLRIIHRQTDLAKLYADFVAQDMPESYVDTLANSTAITKIVHLVASLKEKREINGAARLIVGLAPEATQSHIEQKSAMGYQVEPGSVFLGNLAFEGKRRGDTVELFGEEYRVEKVLELAGSEEDIAIYMNLADAQKALGKPGRITEILALGCKCTTTNRVEEITAQLEAVLPEAKVTELRVQAIARDQQRKLVESYHAQARAEYLANRTKITAEEAQARQEIIAREREYRERVRGMLASVISIVIPLITLVAAIWVGMLAWNNVRERQTEIGLLRAIGKGSGDIAALFLGKAVVLGLAGGVLGCLAGLGLVAWVSNSLLSMAAPSLLGSPMVLLIALVGTPLVAALASYLPTLLAIRQDPASILSNG